ncbi:TonB-dependent receptor, partial [bacterium]|nr:TonB-dependent receptor [bacterium]
GNVKQKFGESELYYDYTTTKPQLTAFAHALWRFGNLNIMTDISASTVKYHIIEDIPSGSNYPDDPEPHGGDTWTGTATDADGNPIEYVLWDHERTFNFISPKFGANYNLTENINVFANWSQAINEPRVKYFFAYGSPNEALELEGTDDIELGAGYKGDIAGIFLDAKYNFYHIQFHGKALSIMNPEMTNKPGYDYKGRRFIPIGESTYSGHELAVNADLPFNLRVGFNMSIASNLWGEPKDSEGAQHLYSSDIVVAGVDFVDSLSGKSKYDNNGSWDPGEKALHKKFVDKFGKKVEVGMPQTIFGGTLNYTLGGFFINTAIRHYRDIYILENNTEVTVDGHLEDDGSWVSDKESSTLPSATVIDMVLGYRLAAAGFPVNISLHINNILDTEYWQKGDSYGFGPGAARTIILNTSVTL